MMTVAPVASAADAAGYYSSKDVRDLITKDSHQPDVPHAPGSVRARRADVAAEEKLATDLSRVAPPEPVDSEKPATPVAKSVMKETELAGRVLDGSWQASPEVIRMPEESREQPTHSGKGDTELAKELSAGSRTERDIAAGLSRPVQHDAPERMPSELSHEPSRNIQKER